jgi:hypothetical protein
LSRLLRQGDIVTHSNQFQAPLSQPADTYASYFGSFYAPYMYQYGSYQYQYPTTPTPTPKPVQQHPTVQTPSPSTPSSVASSGPGVFTVQDSGSLLAALSAAVSGDTIKLAAGTYSGVSINGLNLSGVTIESADTSHRAVLTDLSVTNSSGLAFDNLEFSFAAASSDAGTTAFGMSVTQSSNISFDHDSIHGTLDHDPTLDIKGLLLANDTSVSVTNTEFQQLRVGITQRTNTGVTISGDNFHDLRVDGIDTTGSSNVTISDNNFSNFWRVGTPATGGDHGDAIQFWTQDGQSPNTDTTISNNVMVQGQGTIFQGIFLQDLSTGMVLPFQNVIISGNLIIGGSLNAINVKGAENVSITDNAVVALAGSVTPTPMVQLQVVNGATLSNNSAPKFQIDSLSSNIIQSNDVITSAAGDGGLSTLTNWLSQHSHPMGVGFTSANQLLADSLTALFTPPSSYTPPSYTPPSAPGHAPPSYIPPSYSQYGLSPAGYFGIGLLGMFGFGPP